MSLHPSMFHPCPSRTFNVTTLLSYYLASPIDLFIMYQGVRVQSPLSDLVSVAGA